MTQVFLAVSHQLRFPSQIQLPTGNLMFNLDAFFLVGLRKNRGLLLCVFYVELLEVAAPWDSHDGIWHAKGYSPGFPGSNNTHELLMS